MITHNKSLAEAAQAAGVITHQRNMQSSKIKVIRDCTAVLELKKFTNAKV